MIKSPAPEAGFFMITRTPLTTPTEVSSENKKVSQERLDTRIKWGTLLMPIRFRLPTALMFSSEFSQYLTDIGRYPVLSRETQLRHCMAIHRWQNWEGGKDKAPRSVKRLGKRGMEMMITTNLRLVVSVAKKYQGKGVTLEDLIQEGNLGLIRGLELFDPARGYQVSTYAYWWIRQGITRSIYSTGRTIRMPINSHEMLVKIRRHRNRIEGERGTLPTVEETAEYVDCKPERVRELLSRWVMTECFSLDQKVQGCDQDIINSISDPQRTPLNDPSEYLLSACGNDRLKAAMYKLSDEEATVIKGVFEQNLTQKHLGEELNVSRARVGQVQQKAMKRLRLLMSA